MSLQRGSTPMMPPYTMQSKFDMPDYPENPAQSGSLHMNKKGIRDGLFYLENFAIRVHNKQPTATISKPF